MCGIFSNMLWFVSAKLEFWICLCWKILGLGGDEVPGRNSLPGKFLFPCPRAKSTPCYDDNFRQNPMKKEWKMFHSFFLLKKLIATVLAWGCMLPSCNTDQAMRVRLISLWGTVQMIYDLQLQFTGWEKYPSDILRNSEKFLNSLPHARCRRRRRQGDSHPSRKTMARQRG